MKSELKGRGVIDAHKKVRNYVKKVYSIARKNASIYGFSKYEVDSIFLLKNALSILFKMRKEADYELSPTVGLNNVGDARARINEIRLNNSLDNFKGILQTVISELHN